MMNVSVVSLKAHCAGYTQAVYDTESECIVSGGADGFLHIWSYPDSEKIISHKLSRPITGLVYEHERVFVSSESNKVELMSTVSQIPGSVYSQFLSNVNHICISDDKTKIVACSDDFTVKILDLVEKIEHDFKFHKAPVMSVSINCKNTFIASSSCDGFVNLLDVTNKTLKNKWKVLHEEKSVKRVANNCRIKFSPVDEKMLAVPLEKSIEFYNCFGGNVMFSLNFTNFTKGSVKECLFSFDGKLFSAGFSDGFIIIWSLEKQNVVYKNKCSRESEVQSMVWLPGEHLSLLYTDSTGYFEVSTIKLEENIEDNDSVNMEEDNFEQFFEGTVEELDDEAKESRDMDDVDIDDDGDNFNDDVDNDVDYDIELSQIKKDYEPIESIDSNIITETPIVTTKIIREEREPHPPVRCGSASKVQDMELLLWNPIVVIKKHYDHLSDDDDSSNGFTELDFQDQSLSKNFIIRHNIIEYHMADANYFALMLISVKDNNSDYGARIDVRPLGITRWNEWTKYLPEKEYPLACCLVGDRYAVVLTDRNLIRYFSLECEGTELLVETIPGCPVSIMGSGTYSATYEMNMGNMVTVIDASGSGDRLMLRIDTLQADVTTVVTTAGLGWIDLPLSKESKLFWIGFSNTGSVYSVDTKNQVRKLQVFANGARWYPVLDLKKALSKERRQTDRHFPIGIMDDINSESGYKNIGVMSVLCCGTRTPRLVPLPHLLVVPFNIPLCPPQSDTLELEKKIVQNRLIYSHFTNNFEDEEVILVEEKKMLLKLFTMSVMNNEDSRAYGIAKLMPDSQLVNLAIQFAARSRKKQLTQKLSELALKKDEVATNQKQEYSNENSGEEENEETENDKENQYDSNKLVSHPFLNRLVDSVTEPNSDNESDEEKDKSIDMVNDTQELSLKIKQTPLTPFTVEKGKPDLRSLKSSSNVLDKLIHTKSQDNALANSSRTEKTGFGSFTPKVLPHEQSFKLKNKRKSICKIDSPTAKNPRN